MQPWMARLSLLLPVFLAVLPGFARAVQPATECSSASFEGVPFITCTVSARDDLRLFHSGEAGLYGSFRAINQALAAEGKTLGFAMNAGMYHADRSPVGLYIEGGSERSALVTSAGPGNFGMLPNGVFCRTADRFHITDSRKFEPLRAGCSYATQSGPMLLIDGELHPRFLEDSDSRYIRNGVGVDASGSKAVFVISERAVNFHLFARFFRDHLGLGNALYFDGNISRLYAPGIGRHDGGFAMGPIVGTVIDAGGE